MIDPASPYDLQMLSIGSRDRFLQVLIALPLVWTALQLHSGRGVQTENNLLLFLLGDVKGREDLQQEP